MYLIVEKFQKDIDVIRNEFVVFDGNDKYLIYLSNQYDQINCVLPDHVRMVINGCYSLTRTDILEFKKLTRNENGEIIYISGYDPEIKGRFKINIRKNIPSDFSGDNEGQFRIKTFSGTRIVESELYHSSNRVYSQTHKIRNELIGDELHPIIMACLVSI